MKQFVNAKAFAGLELIMSGQKLTIVSQSLRSLQFDEKTVKNTGSGCGSVNRAVASNKEGLRFESSYQQTFICRAFVYS